MAPQPASTQDLVTYLVQDYWIEDGQKAHRYDTSKGQPVTFDISGLSPEGQALAMGALQAWSAVVGRLFKAAARGEEGDIIIDDARSGASSSSDYSASGLTNVVRINIGPEWLVENGTEIGSYSYRSFLHEIGHALGLGHTGQYGGGADYATEALFQNDSWQMTVMSYFDQEENTDTDATWAIPVTPMMADILAMQQVYGKAMDGPTAGDTAWGLGSRFGTLLDQVFEGDGAGLRDRAMTIWDAGGFDTLDLSNDTTDQVVSLVGGAFSDVYGERGNLAIMADTVIEAYRAGSGNDQVTGNGAANHLNGGAGDDRLAGGAGNDAYVVDTLGDSLVEAVGGGTDTVLALLSWTLGAEFENLTLLGRADLDGAGHGGRNALAGNAGANALDGAAGDDRIQGRAGDDRLVGGDGRDHLDGGAGNDLLEGGAGRDTFALSRGRDRIADFDWGTDRIQLPEALTRNGRFDAEEVLDRISHVAGDDLVLRAGARVLRLDDVPDLDLLARDLIFV